MSEESLVREREGRESEGERRREGKGEGIEGFLPSWVNLSSVTERYL